MAQLRQVTDVQNAVASLRQHADFLKKKEAAVGKADIQLAMDKAELKRAIADIVECLSEVRELLQEVE